MSRESFASVFSVVLGLFVMLVGVPVSAVDSARGKLLYENTCGTCHESALHIRERRTVQAFAQIQAQVLRWSAAAEARWTAEEVQDVTDYLNSTFYRYPCSPEQCSLATNEK